jgi:2-hydroxychromene-2-carboxylate isomerase
MSSKADWYFDFISPYAYLQFKHFHRLPSSLNLTLRPILFAGLLDHWKTKGPAEIPAKRTQTYQYCDWYSKRIGLPFKTPPAHPFNPLKILRLAIALNSPTAAIGAIFDYVWGEGGDTHSEEGFKKLCDKMAIKDVAALIGSKEVKNQLHENTTQAIKAGVYGVPTFHYEGDLFWGFDTTEMFLERINDPFLLAQPEMLRLADLPAAQERKSINVKSKS